MEFISWFRISESDFLVRMLEVIDYTECSRIYIYMVAPPQGLPEREGMYHLPSVVLNTFKDMLRKHCKFQCFMHILLVLF